MHIQQTKAPSIPIRSPGKRPAITTDMVAPISVAAILLAAFASAAPRVGCARIATVTAADDAPPELQPERDIKRHCCRQPYSEGIGPYMNRCYHARTSRAF